MSQRELKSKGHMSSQPRSKAGLESICENVGGRVTVHSRVRRPTPGVHENMLAIVHSAYLASENPAQGRGDLDNGV